MTLADESEPRQTCDGCGNEIDPDCCWCGTPREYHGSPMSEGHGFIPIGCDCHSASDDALDGGPEGF